MLWPRPWLCPTNPYYIPTVLSGVARVSGAWDKHLMFFFVTLSLNNLGFGHKWQHHYIYFRFFSTGLKWTFLSQKSGFYSCILEWLWNTHRLITLINVIASTVFRRGGVYNSVTNHTQNFRHGGHKPEVVWLTLEGAVDHNNNNTKFI